MKPLRQWCFPAGGRNARGAAPGAGARPGCGDGRGEAGITLIEVLVSITLLAMLATLIANGIRLTGRAWVAAEVRAEDVDDMATVQALLRRTIGGARPSYASADPASHLVRFEGTAERLSLVAPRSGLAEEGEWLQQVLYVAPHEGRRGLFLAWQPDAPHRGRADLPAERTLLLDGVAGIRFGYYGRGADGGAAAWRDSWSGRTTLPALVRLQIDREGGAGQAWPPLVMRTRVTANTTCVYDFGRTGCERMGQ